MVGDEIIHGTGVKNASIGLAIIERTVDRIAEEIDHTMSLAGPCHAPE
jgi:hypothetical protein